MFSELKKRLIFVFLCFTYNFIVCGFNHENLIFYTTKPVLKSSYFENEGYFIYSGTYDLVFFHVETVFLFTFYITVYNLTYQSILVSTPAFRFSESKFFGFVMKFFFVTWVIILPINNNVLIPLTTSLFLTFTNLCNNTYPYKVFFEANILSYANLYIDGIIHELAFVFLYLFFFALLIKSKNWVYCARNYRRVFYCFFLGLATITSPPDIISQFVLTLLFVLIYEVSIVLSVSKNDS